MPFGERTIPLRQSATVTFVLGGIDEPPRDGGDEGGGDCTGVEGPDPTDPCWMWFVTLPTTTGTLTCTFGGGGGSGGRGIHALRRDGLGRSGGGGWTTGAGLATATCWQTSPVHDVPPGHTHASPCATDPPGQVWHWFAIHDVPAGHAQPSPCTTDPPGHTKLPSPETTPPFGSGGGASVVAGAVLLAAL